MAGNLAEEDVKGSQMRMRAFFAIGTSLLISLAAYAAQYSLDLGDGRDLRREFPDWYDGRIVKTTPDDCRKHGGKILDDAPDHPLLIDCLLLIEEGDKYAREEVARPHPQSIRLSVYDYLSKIGQERTGHGLYSYVLFPVHSPRAESFLEALFKTTNYVVGLKIERDYLNVIYLPMQADKVSTLVPMIHDGAAPPVSLFAAEFYDYALAQTLLAHVCAAPAEGIRDLCATDLSRGPYLFTYARPASTLSPVPPPYLVLDLSGVHIRAFGEFITAYKEQVMRPNYSDRERVDGCASIY